MLAQFTQTQQDDGCVLYSLIYTCPKAGAAQLCVLSNLVRETYLHVTLGTQGEHEGCPRIVPTRPHR